MATLGSVYHDFPRLAKQSGFYFQLHTGRVNWSEIERVNVDEIIEKRNFQLLEENLINVINCNLEREYDLKILDPNFVKLFKLAQLGVDYLSYCEMYLDKCVVLLQEQLTAFQEDFEALKQKNERRKEELNKSKRKNKAQNYQCDKCEKVFISDVYLKFHDKRRHSIPTTPNSLDKSQKRRIDNWQQTDDGRKLSTSTQTLHFEELPAVSQEHEDRGRDIKIEYTIKIEKLEQELKDLKERLKKAETSLTERTEASKSNAFQSPYPPGPIYYNPMLMLLPSYLKQSNNVQHEVSDNTVGRITAPVPETPKPNSTGTPTSGIARTVESIPQPQIYLEINSELEKVEKSSVTTENNHSFREVQFKRNDSLEREKENLDSNIKENISTNLTKPLPPPRKSKRTQPPVNKMMVVDDFNQAEEPEGFGSQSIIHRLTPVKTHEDSDFKIHDASRDHFRETPETNSTESTLRRNSVESKSLIKKIVGKNSPKLRTLSKSLKRSLTNLYDSVSSNEKDCKKTDPSEKNSKEAIINRVESRLRELGVDPAWQGIPRKTMKQKLNFLKYKRKLLSKKIPMYPIIRQNIEEKIVQKLKNNTLLNKLSKQHSTDVEDSASKDFLSSSKPDFVKVKNCVMYDMESDSESQNSISERNFDGNPHTLETGIAEDPIGFCVPENKLDTERVKEFDFSVFQVGSESLKNLTEEIDLKKVSFIKEGGLRIRNSDSDSDDDFIEQSDEKVFHNLSGYITNIKKTENTDTAKCCDESSFPKTQKEENQNILKDEGFQSRLPTTEKKKVFFADYSDAIEELSDSPLDDDLWPFKSDSEKDMG